MEPVSESRYRSTPWNHRGNLDMVVTISRPKVL